MINFHDFVDICSAPEWSFLRFAILIGLLVSPTLGIIGTLVVTRRISSLVTFGREAENIALGAINHAFKADNISINTNLENPGATAKTVYDMLHRGDAVLFKASRSMALERIIAYLRENSSRLNKN